MLTQIRHDVIVSAICGIRLCKGVAGRASRGRCGEKCSHWPLCFLESSLFLSFLLKNKQYRASHLVLSSCHFLAQLVLKAWTPKASLPLAEMALRPERWARQRGDTWLSRTTCCWHLPRGPLQLPRKRRSGFSDVQGKYGIRCHM